MVLCSGGYVFAFTSEEPENFSNIHLITAVLITLLDN